MNNTFCLVTGMPRSGTTLVDKTLSISDRIGILSQPLPLLFVKLKSIFLDQKEGVSPLYPLDDMFLQTAYPPAELIDFLNNYRIDRDLVEDVLQQMIEFSGQYTKPNDPLFILKSYTPQTLSVFVKTYLSNSVDVVDGIVGLKEAYCEEFVPFLLQEGWMVVIVIRDPRDIITSLDYGRGDVYGGRRKPLLYNLRSWRKSAAMALSHSNRSQLSTIRYEDFVSNPQHAVDFLTGFLGVPHIKKEWREVGLRSQAGGSWKHNSSHSGGKGIFDTSVGTYRTYLDDDTDAFIQACCWPEMHTLGYDVSINISEAGAIMDAYIEARKLERPELARYQWCPERLLEEKKRLALLSTAEYDPRYFPIKEAFQAIQRATATRV